MRVGQKGTLTRVRAATGSRPTALRADGYRSVHLFGAVCPARDLGCALILPRCDTAAMAPFPAELSGHVAPGAHALLVPDGAGWHTARELRPGPPTSRRCRCPPPARS
jgi:putative transposase